MKHLMKFESKKNKEINPEEKLEELYFDFINAADLLGKQANYEKRSSDGATDEAIYYFEKLLNDVNQKFNKLKTVK